MRRGRKPPSHSRGLPNLQCGKTRTAECNRGTGPALAGGKWEFVTIDVYPYFRQFTRKVLQAKEQKRRRTLREMGGTSQLTRPPEGRSTQLREQTSQLLRRSTGLDRQVPAQTREEEEINVDGSTTTTTPENGEANNTNNCNGNNENHNTEEDGNSQ